MSISGDLFGPLSVPGTVSPVDTAQRPATPPEVAFLVTNHLNLMYMLAAGLVMPPAGFGDKYYRDPLASFPGWIPLFVDRVPEAALRLSTEEAGHLKPAIAEIRLDDLSGTLLAGGTDGVREVRFPDEFGGAESVLLIPAPLPVSRIRSILLPSPEERKAFNDAAANFGNVPVQDFRRGTRKTLFAKASSDPWPPTRETRERNAPLRVPLAVGGVMALLLHVAHRGGLAVQACRQAFDPDDLENNSAPDSASLADNPILAGLSGWMRSGVTSSPSAPAQGSDRERLRNVFQQRLFREHRPGGSTEDILLEFLRDARDTLDERLKPGADNLYETLKSLASLAGATPSELFDRHQTPMARAMILFCLRRNSAGLLDFDHGELREPDWLAAAILFGARDGWLSMPLELRTVPGLARGELSAAISHRMARLAHRIAGSDLNLGSCPPRIRPLRELLRESGGWRTRERSAALELSRACKWDCIKTRVSFPKGEYRLTVSGGSAHVDLPGEPRIASEIDRDRFFKYLANSRLKSRTEAKVRKLLH